MVREIWKLGNPKLYEVSAEVTREDAPSLKGWVADLHDTLLDYRKTYGAGRAIAAPQIGIRKRLLYMFRRGMSFWTTACLSRGFWCGWSVTGERSFPIWIWSSRRDT